MAEILTYGMALIALIALAVLIYVVINQGAIRMIEPRRNSPQQGVIKHDWHPTGRIDFATRSGDLANAKDRERPNEFRLLVEERRIVESIAGNENLEIQWRLATLQE